MLQKVGQKLVALRSDESGATMIEYSVLIALITVVLVSLILAVGGQLETAWQSLTDTLASAEGT